MPLTIVSWNVNSLRSAVRQGFCEWLENRQPEIVCLQEVRATLAQLHPLEPLLKGYKAIWHPAIRPGYAGTAILTKFEPTQVEFGLNNSSDPDGRALTVSFGDFSVASLYAHNATPGTDKIHAKTQWFKDLQAHLQTRHPSTLIVCGDLNVAQSKLDSRGTLHPFGINGCTDEERAAFQNTLDICNLYDPHREHHPDAILSTWWSLGQQERRNDNGIRFDYTLITKKDKQRVITSAIQADVFGSDHCPTSVTIELETKHLCPARTGGQAALL